MIPQYSTVLFSNIYEDVDTFVDEWKESGIYESTVKTSGTTVTPIVSDKKMELLFFLLYAKYGNSPIANMDINQFKYKLWSIVFQYGPS